jgi:hypothetical protein
MTALQIRRLIVDFPFVQVLIAFLLLGTGGTAAAGTGDPAPDRRLSAVANIRFQGISTLHDFEGTVRSQPFILVLSSNAWSAEANVLGNGMSTAHDGRDKNMKKMIETNRHPILRGTVRNAVIPPVAATNATLSLRIRDRWLDLPVRISDWSETAEAVRFRASWELSLKQYSLKPPSVLGVIRVGDKVRLEAEVTATKPVPATSKSNAGAKTITQP